MCGSIFYETDVIDSIGDKLIEMHTDGKRKARWCISDPKWLQRISDEIDTKLLCGDSSNASTESPRRGQLVHGRGLVTVLLAAVEEDARPTVLHVLGDGAHAARLVPRE